MIWDELLQADKARVLVPALTTTQKKALQFSCGDYWGVGGEDWPAVIPKDAANRAELLDELNRTFTPQPITEEITEGYVNGVVGDEPAFEFALNRSLGKKGDKIDGEELDEDEEPTPQETQLLGEVNSAIGSWWDKCKGHEMIQDFVENLVTTQRASLRYFVPEALLDESGRLLNARGVPVANWEEALDSIYMEVPTPGSSTVAVDRATMKPISVFVYQHIEKNKKGKEVAKERIEISFVNADGQTVIRILEGNRVIDETEQDTGGELYVDEARLRKPIIGDATLRQQRALNVINTGLLCNGNLVSGFRERNYINLQRPQKAVPDTTQPNGIRYEDDAVEIGPYAANFFNGIVYKDLDGNEKVANGQIVIADPVSPEPLIAAKECFELNIYKNVRQLHVMISGDAVASAVSRVQARADFIERLKKLKPKIEGVLRSRLLGVVLLACFLADDTSRLEAIKTELRVNVNCRLSPGPLTPEERQAVIALYEAGIIPLETAQIFLGIEDVDAEAQKLRRERNDSLALLLERAKIIRELAAAGAGIESAALTAGFTPEQAKLLAKGDFELPEDESGEEEDEENGGQTNK